VYKHAMLTTGFIYKLTIILYIKVDEVVEHL